jgi:hypothetical protein
VGLPAEAIGINDEVNPTVQNIDIPREKQWFLMRIRHSGLTVIGLAL